MVLGEHGRRLLRPMTPLQCAVAFPWKRLYNHSIYFRMFSRVTVGMFCVWGYIGYKGKSLKKNPQNHSKLFFVYLKGIDVWFTPYDAVHHSIAHNYAHDLDHKRYPIEHHDDKKH
jgi:hypothetical protein